MSRVTRTAVIQLRTTPDVAHNLARTGDLVAAATAAGAEVVLLPEAFAFLGPESERQAMLEPLPGRLEPGTFAAGPILSACQALARSSGCHLVLGGFHECAPEPGKSFNTCVHLDPAGTPRALYRKIHLFDIALADGTVLRESARTLAGDAVVTTDLPFGRLGLSICYDIRFPYLYQALVDAGAIALTAPSAFTATTGAAHWEVLLRARAIECQAYMLAPAQHGHHWGSRHSWGHSMIVDPWGRIVAECADGEGFAIADIDPAEVARVRAELPSLTHRRPIPGAAAES
ncbi:MAG: carbon-nitrogen hydrolase family protein [Pseudomonadales bacterium]|nr:carbon-nitrogen hydrolase family protein [Pseudomonadales bacterium]